VVRVDFLASTVVEGATTIFSYNLLFSSLAALNVGKLFYFTFKHGVEVQDSIFHLTITENKIHNKM